MASLDQALLGGLQEKGQFFRSYDRNQWPVWTEHFWKILKEKEVSSFKFILEISTSLDQALFEDFEKRAVLSKLF